MPDAPVDGNPLSTAFNWLRTWNAKRKAAADAAGSTSSSTYDELNKSLGGSQSKSKAEAIQALKDADKG